MSSAGSAYKTTRFDFQSSSSPPAVAATAARRATDRAQLDPMDCCYAGGAGPSSGYNSGLDGGSGEISSNDPEPSPAASDISSPPFSDYMSKWVGSSGPAVSMFCNDAPFSVSSCLSHWFNSRFNETSCSATFKYRCFQREVSQI